MNNIGNIREQDEARQRAQLGALLAKLSEGVIIAEANGRVRMINAAAKGMLGLEGRTLANVDELNTLEARTVEGELLAFGDRPLTRALRGEELDDCESLHGRPGGDMRRLLTSGTSVKDDRGNVVLAILVVRDVTELRLLERQREEYTALISHDLRSPLSSILMFTSTLKQSLAKKGLAEEVSIAESIERNARRMNAMLDEVTEEDSLESHGVELRRVPCDLRELVEGVVGSMDVASARRVEVDANDAGRFLVLADIALVERCLGNLFANAFRYSTGDAPVRIHLRRNGDDVEVDVIDFGSGIAPESIRRVFDRHYRTEAGRTRTGRLGLGLYITRLIVEAHRGRIEVISEVGKGSMFRMMLPSQETGVKQPSGRSREVN